MAKLVNGNNLCKIESRNKNPCSTRTDHLHVVVCYYILLKKIFKGMDATLSFDGASYRCFGNCTELNNFINEGLKLSGKRSSTGEDVKLFTAGEDFVLKWKLVILQSNRMFYSLVYCNFAVVNLAMFIG